MVLASLYLVTAKVLIHVVPFRYYKALLGKEMFKSRYGSSPLEKEYLYIVSRVVSRCSSHMPWKRKCFPESIAAKLMLKRKKIKSDLYLGLKRSHQNTLFVHSWLKCGDISIVGTNFRKMHIVTFFGDP